MKLIESSLKNPVAVGMVVLLVAVFGFMSLRQLPLQLFPDIERPQISVQTNWRAASPEEVESELLEPQEEVLQGLPGVEQLDGTAGSGGSNIDLTFAIGTDMKNALVEVIGRINRVRSIPKDADRPVVQVGGNGGGNANESLSWFFVQLLPGTPGPVDSYRHFIENTVKPRIESVPGVSQVIVNAGPPDEVRITVDMAKAAEPGRDDSRYLGTRSQRGRHLRWPDRSGPPAIRIALHGPLQARGSRRPGAVVARRQADSPRRCRHDQDATAGTAVLRLPERQPRHRPGRAQGQRRECAGDAERGEENRRRVARRPAQGQGPGHRAVVRFLAVHQSRSESAQ